MISLCSYKFSKSPKRTTIYILCLFLSYLVFIFIILLNTKSISHLLGRPAYRFRKPDNYLSSRVQKKLISKLRRSATAPDGVANMKNERGEGHQDSIFHDASAFVKRGLTIKRLRSDELILFQQFVSVNFLFSPVFNSM